VLASRSDSREAAASDLTFFPVGLPFPSGTRSNIKLEQQFARISAVAAGFTYGVTKLGFLKVRFDQTTRSELRSVTNTSLTTATPASFSCLSHISNTHVHTQASAPKAAAEPKKH